MNTNPQALRAQDAPTQVAQADIRARVEALGPWFHNMNLGGVATRPEHPLGDYPMIKWSRFAHALADKVTGRTVLDIGCNGGFYAIEMMRRGAKRVVAIDSDERYLAQARFAARICGEEIEFHCMSVFDVASLRERFDIVLFMGVVYHLRHPLLALDLISEHVADDLLVFQSMQRGSAEVAVQEEHDIWQTAHFDSAGYPKLHFIETRYANDPTNWWIPNRACAEAMLRSAGFEIQLHPEAEVYLCRRARAPEGGGPVYPTRGAP